MRKACINLDDTLKITVLLGGDLGGGKCLHLVNLLDGSHQLQMENLKPAKDNKEPTPEEWASSLSQCLAKADELKYEVTRIRGKRLTER